MKLDFEQLPYQIDAVNAVVGLFQGEQNQKEVFSLRTNNDFSIVANQRTLSFKEIEKNLHNIQKRFRQPETHIGEHGLNFSIEMETGTGKTYVYLRTILELNQQYGWRKFVIVTPSVAIREGVLQSIAATKEHFGEIFDNPIYQEHLYRSDQLSKLREFATSQYIDILVMNIDAFKKDDNVINRINESGKAPIELIRQTHPIVIIDEPQNMETSLAKQAIDTLNPLFILRYSATHKNPYHKIYSLNPIEAYNQKLVKQIEVLPVLAQNDVNGAYIVLKEIISGKKTLQAKLEIHAQTPKETKKKGITVKVGDDLYAKSGNNESYRDGFIINHLDAQNAAIEFSNGQVITQTDHDDGLRDEVMKQQIECTIKEHLAKEKKLNPQGIKVLSLFFIDKVANYRNNGKFYRWFNEIYQKLTKEPADGVHDGYFSQDKDTNGSSKADEDTYHLIMRDKEKLLSFDSPLRFIFSHSALKEGWDNPNVFQICTLNETRSPIKKRQEIGRGLRLAVNQQGKRIHDNNINILTIIANESYQSFAANLQKEYQNECGIKFPNGGVNNHNNRKQQLYRKGFTLDPVFLEIWQKLYRKTRYSVQFEREELIQLAVENIKKMPAVQHVRLHIQKAKIYQSQIDGIWGEEKNARFIDVNTNWQIPDVLYEIQRKTELTRQTIYDILIQSERLNEISHNPQRFIDLASENILRALHQLMIDGIQYTHLSEQQESYYKQSLIEWEKLENEGKEIFINDHTFCIDNNDPEKQKKTIFNDYIPLDSHTEKVFAQNCESNEDVQMYFKLPSWFKIPTPIGNYNPDWAIVFKNRQHIYFVAETKNTGKGIQSGIDENLLHLNEQQKIQCAKKHFALEVFDGVKYQVMQSLSEID